MLDDLVKYVLGEWRVIGQSPVSFIIAALVIAGIIWWAMSWGYGRENSLLRQQVSDYKDKLSGASPDQAKARIDELEARLDARLRRVEPRTLTSDQRQAITQAAKTFSPVQLTITHEGSCADCPSYASAFEQSLREAGWSVRSGMVIGPGRRPVRGIAILVSDPANLSADAALLMRGLRAAQIEPELIQQPAPYLTLLITAQAY